MASEGNGLGRFLGAMRAYGGGPVNPEAIQDAVDQCLEDHPEWTTTVEDGAITKAKLDSDLQDTVDNVSSLKSAIDSIDDIILVRTKQLLDYENCTQHNATLTSAAGMSTSTHGKVAIVPVSVTENTTITVHRGIIGKRFSIGLSTNSNPAIGEAIRTYTEGNTAESLSLTVTSSDKTLLIYYYLDTQDTTHTAKELLSSIMVNYGPYTRYEPYMGESFIKINEVPYVLTLGSEMFPSSPTWSGTGWSENTAKQYTHNAGVDYQPLVFDIPNIKANTPYLLEFDIDSNTSTGSPDDSTAVYPSVRGSTPFSIYYGLSGNVHYSFTVMSGSDGSLQNTTLMFQPCSATVPSIRGRSFDGTIKNISLKEVTSVIDTNHYLNDENGDKAVSFPQTLVSLRNVLFGINVGEFITTAYENVAVGADAVKNLTSGYWNVGIGTSALEKCSVGSRNIAIGYKALQENSGGDRNIAIGSYALCRNYGFRNIAIGADTLWYNTKGYQNIAIGMATLHSNTTGNENVAVGVHALHENTTGSGNTAVGVRAGYNATGNNNTAIGTDAKIPANVDNSIAIGSNATVTASNQVVIGNSDTEELIIGDKRLIFHEDGTVTWEALTH